MRYYTIALKGTFHGIYEWGRGFVGSDVQQRWNAYWQNARGLFWRFAPAADPMVAPYLASTSGSIYLHPMGFDTMLASNHDCRTCSNDKTYTATFLGEMNELLRLCNEAAAACGGTFTLQASREVPLDVRPDIPYTDEDDYENIGIKTR